LIVDIQHLKQELAFVKMQGCSIDHEEEEAGASCVGAAILGYLDEPIGAVSISGPTGRILGRKAELGLAVKEIAAALSSKLGFSFPARTNLQPLKYPGFAPTNFAMNFLTRERPTCEHRRNPITI
jgi:hypothetical protein